MTDVALSDMGSPWWDEKTKTKALAPATQLFRYIADEDSARLQAYTAYNRIYTNRKIHSNDFLASYTASFAVEGNAYSRVPINLCKVFVDAAHARITRQNPRPVFVTAGGNFTLQKKARQMQKWCEFTDTFTDLRPKKKKASLDSLIYGTGIVKTSIHPVVNEICNERVHPGDLFMDPVEASATDSPTHMYQRAWASRSRLAKMYPGSKKAIKNAGRLTKDEAFSNSRTRATMNNLVEVVEGWRLPSWDGSGDGKHIIFIDGACLELGDYEYSDFPLSVTRWKDDPTVGYWGISLVEELLGLHFDYNNTIRNIEECITAMPTPIIMIPESGNVSEGKLGNYNGLVLTYADKPPTFQVPPSVPTDVVNYADTIWEKAGYVARLTSLSLPEATGGQFESGQAVRDFNDIQGTELAPQFEDFERFNVRVYEAQVRGGRDIYKRDPSFKVVMKNDKYTVEDIDWKVIDDPKKGAFIIQVWPANKLSQTPSGKKDDVLSFFNAGMLDIGEAWSLMDFPDTDHMNNLANAARKNIERILEDMLDENLYTPPEPTLDLRLAMKLTQMYINKAQAMRVPEERVSKLRQFMRQVHTLLQESEEGTRQLQTGEGSPLAGGPPAVSPDGSAPTAIG
jgi:hypothetical protein